MLQQQWPKLRLMVVHLRLYTAIWGLIIKWMIESASDFLLNSIVCFYLYDSYDLVSPSHLSFMSHPLFVSEYSYSFLSFLFV